MRLFVRMIPLLLGIGCSTSNTLVPDASMDASSPLTTIEKEASVDASLSTTSGEAGISMDASLSTSPESGLTSVDPRSTQSGLTSSDESIPPWVTPPSECALEPGCNGSLDPEQSCSPLNTDWWPYRSLDEAGTHHVPEGSVISDLHAEHITPYGGWFTFSSIQTSVYSDDIILCWSEEEFGLDTILSLQIAFGEGRCIQTQTYARQGVNLFPLIVIDLEPSTTYYLRAAYETWEGFEKPSNVVAITTKADPLADLVLNDSHPRVFATTGQMDALKTRYAEGDPRLQYWLDLSVERTNRAISPSGGLSEPGSYSTLAWIFGELTGDPMYVEGGRYLISELLRIYEEELPTGNQYRWATPYLATATDLFWSHLEQPFRQRILDAILTVDEIPSNTEPVFVDTDEYASFVQIQIAHGLTFLGSSDLDPSSLERLQVIFDRAIRRWYGVMQVKMRRPNKIWGLSGGTMDDGIDYAQGTQGYWLETFLMLENVGLSQSDYAPWVWNHAQGQTIHAMVPGLSGYVTYGDIEDFHSNGTLPLEEGTWSRDALNLCLLQRYCQADKAAFVREALVQSREPDEAGGPHHWALLCDNPELPTRDLDNMPTTFWASGYGLVFDRTGWGPDDSFFFFGAGWRAVDHVHDDSGHFSLWSNGGFVTHEIPSYDMSNAAKHNVLLLSESPNQDHLQSPGLSQILEVRSTSTQLYILADLTSAYNHDFDDVPAEFRVVHDSITRTVVWNKVTDEVLVYDRVVGGPLTETGVQNFLGSPPVSSMYNGRVDSTLELLSIVNGSSYFLETDTTFDVAGFGTFDRTSGRLVE